MTRQPKISILVPTCKRPDLLGRCLSRLLVAIPANREDFEVIIGDDSISGSYNSTVIQDFEGKWNGDFSYFLNQNSLGQQGNFNQLIERAKGDFIQFIHDDDFLLPGAGAILLNYVKSPSVEKAPVLFASKLVTLEEKPIRVEGTRRNGYLPPQEAVRVLLSQSSFIRFPGMFVPRICYKDIGMFNPNDLIPDCPVWLKLAEMYGLHLRPVITNAYTVHEASGTTKQFSIEYILFIKKMLYESQKAAGWNSSQMHRAAGEFLHRFILAGCLRSIHKGDFRGFCHRFSIFQHSELTELPCPAKWLLLKAFFRILYLIKSNSPKDSSNSIV